MLDRTKEEREAIYDRSKYYFEGYEAFYPDEADFIEELLEHHSYETRAMAARWMQSEHAALELLEDRSFAVREAIVENKDMLEAILTGDNDSKRRLKKILQQDIQLQTAARAQLTELSVCAGNVLWQLLCGFEEERSRKIRSPYSVYLRIPMEDEDGRFQWKKNYSASYKLTSPWATAMAVDCIFDTFVADDDDHIESSPMTVEIDEFRRAEKLCRVFHSSANPAVRLAAARWVKGDYDCWRDYAFDEDLAVRREVHELCEDADEYEADDYIDFLGNDPERLVEHAGALLRTDFAEWSRRLLRDEDPEVRRAALPLVLAGVTHGAGRRPVEEDADDDIVVSNGWNDDDDDDWLDEEDDEDDSDEEEEEDEEEDAEEDAKGSRKADTESQDPEKPLQS